MPFCGFWSCFDLGMRCDLIRCALIAIALKNGLSDQGVGPLGVRPVNPFLWPMLRSRHGGIIERGVFHGQIRIWATRPRAILAACPRPVEAKRSIRPGLLQCRTPQRMTFYWWRREWHVATSRGPPSSRCMSSPRRRSRSRGDRGHSRQRMIGARRSRLRSFDPRARRRGPSARRPVMLSLPPSLRI